MSRLTCKLWIVVVTFGQKKCSLNISWFCQLEVLFTVTWSLHMGLKILVFREHFVCSWFSWRMVSLEFRLNSNLVMGKMTWSWESWPGVGVGGASLIISLDIKPSQVSHQPQLLGNCPCSWYFLSEELDEAGWVIMNIRKYFLTPQHICIFCSYTNFHVK